MWTLRRKKQTNEDRTARDLLAANRLVTVTLLTQAWR
jgi:hypothetical protein